MTQPDFYIEYSGGKLNARDPDQDIRQRFGDIRADVNRRWPGEAQNKHVLSILMDLYWIHIEDSERQPEQAEWQSPSKLLADGGEPT